MYILPRYAMTVTDSELSVLSNSHQKTFLITLTLSDTYRKTKVIHTFDTLLTTEMISKMLQIVTEYTQFVLTRF